MSRILASQYSTVGLNLNTARAFFLENYTSHKAQEWVSDLIDELLENWEDLEREICVRFPMKPKQDLLLEALNKFTSYVS